MRRFKELGIIVAILMLFAIPVFASTIQSTLGGQDSSGNYHFTVDSDGVLDGASGSTITVESLTGDITGRLIQETEALVSTVIEKVLDADDSGKILVATATTADTTFTLPAAVVGMEFTLVGGSAAAGGKVVKADPKTTADTILYLTLDAGDELDSPGATGDSVTLKCFKANTWVPVYMNGTWVDGGAS